MPVQANADRFLGLGNVYDANRPAVPGVVADVLCRYARVERPVLVADLGCGTGLSCRTWLDRADRVVGVEPNPDMRRQAMETFASLPGGERVEFREGHSFATGLEDASADIVTCSQSLHWMEPEPTFAEAARVLRPGGVFAAVDCDMPPVFDWEVEQAWMEMRLRVHEYESMPEHARAIRWDKAGHLARIHQSRRFHFCREVVLDGVEKGSAVRIEGLARSLGGVSMLLQAGISEDDLGLTALSRIARQVLGDAIVPWVISYRVRLGVMAPA